MLELESLSVAAGGFRLRDIALSVSAGECHAVLGPSGSGKTTLINAVLGVLPPASGRILLDGADITHLPIERRGLGYVPQQLGLFPHLTVRDNLAYSARARRQPVAQIRPLVEKLVEATGIGALLDRRPDTLSGGERQRVGVVRALASQPRLVLLDEPFASLNEALRRDLWRLMRELQQERGLTVLLVTHDLAEAYFLAERVSVLLDGRVAQQGGKEAVYGQPAAAEVARFLGVETLHPGRIVSVCEGWATVEVGAARLIAPAREGALGNVLVSIRGEDVVLRHEGPASNGRNSLVARVVSVQTGSPISQVQLDAGFPLVACLLRPACENLDLRAGATVTAIIKASAVHLIPQNS